MRQVHGGPLAGLASAIVLLAALTATVGLGPSAWVTGLVCAGVIWGLLEDALTRSGLPRLGPANAVTHVRAGLAAGLVALVVSSWRGTEPVALLVGLAVIALSTDAVDGRVARRTGWVTPLGARFDMESDALLILVLSLYVAPRLGWWVLLIGLARYLLLAAGRVRPWLRGETPPRPWAKVVASYQGITLAVAASGLLPAGWSRLLLLVGLVLLAESFGRQVWTLRRLSNRAGRRLVSSGGHPTGRREGEPVMTLRLAAAAAVLISAGVHLKLWLDGMRDIHVIGPAFLLNVAAGLVIAALLFTWHHWLAPLLAAGFGAATLGGFLTAATVGLFGDHEKWQGPYVFIAAAVEIVALATGLAAAATERRALSASPVRVSSTA